MQLIESQHWVLPVVLELEIQCWHRHAYCRDSDQTAAFCGFLAGEVFARSDIEPSAGFALHLADVAIGELWGACEGGPPPPAGALQVHFKSACISDGGAQRDAAGSVHRLPSLRLQQPAERACVQQRLF